MLNQFTADSLGLPVMAGPEEATAVGNLMVQAKGLGVIRSMADTLPIVKSAFPIKEYQPRNHAGWEEPYQRFRRVCERTARK
jgi:sugar (pentulose or hexulose) kinase